MSHPERERDSETDRERERERGRVGEERVCLCITLVLRCRVQKELTGDKVTSSCQQPLCVSVYREPAKFKSEEKTRLTKSTSRIS